MIHESGHTSKIHTVVSVSVVLVFVGCSRYKRSSRRFFFSCFCVVAFYIHVRIFRRRRRRRIKRQHSKVVEISYHAVKHEKN